MKGKKGQLMDLRTGLIILFSAFIVLGMAGVLVNEFQEKLDNTDFTVTNETSAFINSSGYNLSRTTDISDFRAHNFAISEARNSSSGNTIDAANFSLATNGILTNATATVWDSVELDYTYVAGEEGFKGTEVTGDAIQDIAGFMVLVVLIFVVSIILLIVFGFPLIRNQTAV